MTDERIERRLAAILAADVVGYSRLMGQNEERTLSDLKSARRTLVDPSIAAHRGRIVKTTGDGLLAEFASAVDAVTCAAAIQRQLAMRNTQPKLDFRIGINIGDIIVEGDDIFGDGVNIAARLEGIAAPGGICISDDAHRQVRGKADLNFEDIGEHGFKNIAQPVRTWRWLDASGDSAPSPGGGVSPAYPRKPSIVVLPLLNVSGDPQQEYFADGLTQSLTKD